MKIEIDEIVTDEYWIVGYGGHVYGIYVNIMDAVKSLRLFRPDYIKANGLKIRHRISAFADNAVDCSEIIGKGFGIALTAKNHKIAD